MKTALAAPDDGPDKKKYGIPPKDKKGLSKKTEYKYESKHVSKTDGREKKYRGYGDNPAARYSSEDHNMSPRKPDPKDKHKNDERKNPKPKSPQIGQQEYKRSQMQDAMKPKPKDMPKPKPKSPGFDEPKIKRDYKVVPNKIKKPEDKEKANKLKKTASRSKTSIRMKNKKSK
jgi:hypothetical protein